jgi:multiple sugar transport system permease protein
MRSSFHILLFFLATIAFPAEVTMIPVFLQLKEFHLLNTFGALVLPGLAHGFSIFLLKGFFDSLPRELYEAAELDGASEFVTFWNITMNLSKPILAVIALSTFVGAYGTFFYALILAPDPAMWTVMVYVYQLRQTVDPPVVYASLIVTAIPTLLVFVTCQNIILRGIVVPSDK